MHYTPPPKVKRSKRASSPHSAAQTQALHVGQSHNTGVTDIWTHALSPSLSLPPRTCYNPKVNNNDNNDDNNNNSSAFEVRETLWHVLERQVTKHYKD